MGTVLEKAVGESVENTEQMVAYQFDVEVDILQIHFSKQVAEQNDKYIYSMYKSSEYK